MTEVRQKNHPYPAAKTKVIHVQGTEREIGRQHASLVGDGVSTGMAACYFDFWKRLFENRPDSILERSAFRAIKYLIDPLLLGRLTARIPEFAKERVRGISEVAGIPYEQLLTTVVLPDLLPLLQAYLTRLKPASFIDAGAPPRFGCSSFVSNGSRFLHGRNLDFPGVSYWDRYQVIQATQRKGCLKYIGFTTAGVPLGGITGINEAQVSVSLHQHYCRAVSLSGAGPFMISEEILSRAKTAEEALEILRRSRVSTSWAFIVTDGKSRKGFIYECHPHAAGLRRLTSGEPVLAHSNFFQTEECRPAEYATTARMNWDNYWRKTRLEELVTGSRETLTMGNAAKIMSDHFDPYWEEEKIVNRTISQVYNIQSLVLDPEEMKVVIAEGDSPVQIRRYREYDLGRILAGQSGETGEVFEGFRFENPKKLLAKEDYVLSFVAAFGGNFESALERLRTCMTEDYAPEVGYVAAVLCLKKGAYLEASDLLSKAKGWIEDRAQRKGRDKYPPEYFEITLYLARAHDLLGKRAEARSIYELVASHPDLEDSNIRQIAKTAGPYTAKRLSRVVMPYSIYIPFE